MIIGLIIFQLFDIGWVEVLQSLPSNPLFYILFFVLYVTLPIAEIFIYRQVWPARKRDLFKAMITKKVYNEEVMGYSGEVYLYVWGRRHLTKSDLDIIKNVRDNNIISSLTSNLVAFSLIGVLIFTGLIDIGLLIDNVDVVYATVGIIIAIVLVVLFIQFRKYLFSLSLKKTIIIFSIYLSRFLIHNALLIVQWAVAVPQTSLSIWFLFVVIFIAVNRIPFLPSRDLVFMWAGIELSKALSMATASVAGMLLVTSAMKKSLNLILFIWLNYIAKSPELKEMEQQEVSKGE